MVKKFAVGDAVREFIGEGEERLYVERHEIVLVRDGNFRREIVVIVRTYMFSLYKILVRKK